VPLAGGRRPPSQKLVPSPSVDPEDPFTAAQYEELEHQALIYKYLVAGVPVPPDLLLPIRWGFDSLAARFYHHPARTYPLLAARLHCSCICSCGSLSFVCLFIQIERFRCS
jgi:hypothetical protein